MNALLQAYLPLVVFIGIATVIGLALMIAPFVVAWLRRSYQEITAVMAGSSAALAYPLPVKGTFARASCTPSLAVSSGISVASEKASSE
jgi:hypothetical protein